MTCKYTFFYIVGGKKTYYDQLQLSIKSLKNITTPFKIKILDIGKQLKSSENIEVVYIDKNINQKHVFWQYKYFICQALDTEYGIYLDCDTVVCYDRLKELFEKTGDSFGVIPHFYVQNFKNYLNIFNSLECQNYCKQYNLTEKNMFYTAGVYLFANNSTCKNILKETFDLHNTVYNSNMEYHEGLYDETFLSTVLKNYNHVSLNGSANHCSANLMPLKVENDILLGKNPFDTDYEPIFVLHGSSERQKEAQDFTGNLKNKVINFWK
jgi:hypothetical protein